MTTDYSSLFEELNETLSSINAINMNTAVATTDTSAQMAGTALASGLIGFFLGFVIIASCIAFVIGILTIIANWKIFTKAGEKGWKALIPIYNLVILFKVAGISPLWVLGYLAAWVPIAGPLLCLGITIYAMINLSRAFGKDDGFAVGLILLNTIFIMILGFGKSEYQLNKGEAQEETVEPIKEETVKEAEVIEDKKEEKE